MISIIIEIYYHSNIGYIFQITGGRSLARLWRQHIIVPLTAPEANSIKLGN